MSEEKICQFCGKPIENNYKFCPHCNKEIIEEQEPNETKCIACGEIIENGYSICPHCGKDNDISEKKGTTCLILFILGGVMFLHRFYVGKILSAIILCLFFIIALIISSFIPLTIFVVVALIIYIWDFIQLINEKFTDSKGKYVKIDKNKIENKKCKSCGKFIEKSCLICPYCKSENNDIFSEKNGIIYLILLIFLGFPFLIHRFYIGKVKSASIIILFDMVYISLIILFVILSVILLGEIVGKSIIPVIISIIGMSVIVWINDLVKFFRGEAQDYNGKYIKIK